MLWKLKNNIWRFTPNPKYYIKIRKHDTEERYLVEIWKDKDWYEEPIFLIGYCDTLKEIEDRIQYVLTHQYADLRSNRNYEVD